MIHATGGLTPCCARLSAKTFFPSTHRPHRLLHLRFRHSQKTDNPCNPPGDVVQVAPPMRANQPLSLWTDRLQHVWLRFGPQLGPTTRIFEVACSNCASCCDRLHSNDWFRSFHHNGRYVKQVCHQREQGGLSVLRCLVLDMQLTAMTRASSVSLYPWGLARVCRLHTVQLEMRDDRIVWSCAFP